MSHTTNDDFLITFLGVRGSTPCCDKKYEKYGGHTSCVMLEVAGQLIFLDAGSGLLSANPLIGNTSTIHILLSHTHLDHIMGLPFLKAVWQHSQNIHMYAGNLKAYGGLHQTMKRVFSPPLFPVDFDRFGANIVTHDIEPGTNITINNDVFVSTCWLNHPDGAVGYRIHYRDKSVCYVTDTEHQQDGMDTNILKLAQDADLFIYDSSYEDETYSQFKGWGHSTWQEGCRLGEAARSKRTAIFHHDPLNTDDVMDNIAAQIQKRYPNAFVATQGLTVVL